MIELQGKRIDLNMTPQEAMQKEIALLGNVAYPFVDCWDFKTALAFMVYSEDGKKLSVERFTEEDQEKLGISKSMLLGAIDMAGGMINLSGHYPISEAIKNKLRVIESDQ